MAFMPPLLKKKKITNELPFFVAGENLVSKSTVQIQEVDESSW